MSGDSVPSEQGKWSEELISTRFWPISTPNSFEESLFLEHRDSSTSTSSLHNSSSASKKCFSWLIALTLPAFFLFVVVASLNIFLLAKGSLSVVFQGTIARGDAENITMDSSSQKHERGAICLVGAARDFELTGPSIKMHLLRSYPNADVFVNMALDHKTHTVTLLEDVANLARVNVFAQCPMQEAGAPRQVLSAVGSPHGRQGLLQYFSLVEGCLHLIDSFTKEHAVEYSWILRTRVDTFWTGPVPPILPVKHNTYIVPRGSSFGGLNDRFGFGGVNESRIALGRLAMLESLRQKRLQQLNSEKAFAYQLRVSGIQVLQIDIKFCVLTRRVGGRSILNQWGLPIVAISSEGPMNGAKCAPCTPIPDKKKTREMIMQYNKGWGWPGSNHNLTLCSLNHAWEEGWEIVYDKQVGPKTAAQRKVIMSRSYASCVRNFTVLQNLPGVYSGPPAGVVCRIGVWGQFSVVGKSHMSAYLNPLSTDSTVFSVQFGGDHSLERELQKEVNCTVLTFHVKLSGVTVNQQLSKLLKAIVSQNWTLSWKDRHQIQHVILPQPALVSSMDNLTSFMDNSTNSLDNSSEVVKPKTLNTIIQKRAHKKIDLLILAVNGKTLNTVVTALSFSQRRIPVCQLILRLEPLYERNMTTSMVATATKMFESIGFIMINCKGSYSKENCLFLREPTCDY